MPFDDEAMRHMDEAAEQAQDELKAQIDNMSAQDLIKWWSKWYMKAGHKRLGRILVSMGKSIK